VKRSPKIHIARSRAYWGGLFAGVLPLLVLILIDVHFLDNQMSELMKDTWWLGTLYLVTTTVTWKAARILCVDRHHPEYEPAIRKIRRHFETGDQDE